MLLFILYQTSGQELLLITSILELAETSVDDLLSPKTYEEFQARIERASAKISDQIFKYWTQNEHLKVKFSVDRALRAIRGIEKSRTDSNVVRIHLALCSGNRVDRAEASPDGVGYAMCIRATNREAIVHCNRRVNSIEFLIE